jgi:hypothetical protein
MFKLEMAVFKNAVHNQARVSLFSVHFCKIGHVMYISIITVFYLSFAIEKIKRCLVSNVSKGNIMLCRGPHGVCKLQVEPA